RLQTPPGHESGPLLPPPGRGHQRPEAGRRGQSEPVRHSVPLLLPRRDQQSAVTRLQPAFRLRPSSFTSLIISSATEQAEDGNKQCGPDDRPDNWKRLAADLDAKQLRQTR